LLSRHGAFHKSRVPETEVERNVVHQARHITLETIAPISDNSIVGVPTVAT
jgi:hypothetical protein